MAATTPELGSRKPEAVLSQTWLSATFLHAHESPAGFERLLHNHVQAHAPATLQKELLTFRIAQKAWILHRIETLDRALADSTVIRIRNQYRPARRAPAPPLAAALTAAATQGEQRSDLANSTPEAALSPSSCLAAAFLEDHGNQAAAQRTLAKLRNEHE